MKALIAVVSVLVGSLVLGPIAVGADVIGDDGPNVLTGTAGSDALYGRGGNDTLRGERGNDDLDGGAGADDLQGGAGVDAASYDGPAGVQVTLDNAANDGQPGEGDNVHSDIEAVYGGPGPDTLSGNGRSNTLDGGDGDDRIVGRAGRDFLYGGAGNDTIEAKDGSRDVIDCGSGTDRVIFDRADKRKSCESRAAEPQPTFSRRATGTIRNFWSWARTFTLVNTLEIRDLTPADVTVAVSCRGGGCPFSKRTFNGDRPVVLTGSFNGRRLAVGTRIEIRITAADALGKYARYKMRAAKRPARRVACLLPGRSAPVKCP